MAGEWSVAVQDADQFALQVGGVNISKGAGQSGYADGKWFTSKQLSPSFTEKEGTDGAIARAKTNRRLIECTISLLGTSASNAYLSGLHLLDVNAPNGAGIGSLVLQNMQGTTVIRCTRSWIVTFADVELDRDVTMRTWTLRGPWSVYLVGS